MESHHDIEDQAAAFLAQRDGGGWTDQDQARLEEWLNESTARRVGFLRLEASWDEARRLRALGAGHPPGTVPPPGEWRRTPFFDSESPHQRGGVARSSVPAHRVRPWAFAATVLLALGVGAYLMPGPRGDRYSTPIGGTASVPLSDGSHITLNTATQVRVELTPEERHIRLDEGEAFFEVAHDATRPFVVQVGNKRVIAVGTKFSVRRTGDDIRVVVTEGKVRMESGSARGGEGPNPVAVSRDRKDAVGAGEVFLTPGSIASASDAGIVVEQKAVTEAEADLSWREGYLTFHDVSLADAVAEFNRYNAHKIAIEDPRVAAIRISGTFRAVNYEAFVRVLDDGFAIHSKSSQDSTTLTR